MTAQQAIGLALLIACSVALIWRVRRDLDRAFELGWQNGRLWERHLGHARQQELRASEAQLVERDAGAVN